MVRIGDKKKTVDVASSRSGTPKIGRPRKYARLEHVVVHEVFRLPKTSFNGEQPLASPESVPVNRPNLEITESSAESIDDKGKVNFQSPKDQVETPFSVSNPIPVKDNAQDPEPAPASTQNVRGRKKTLAKNKNVAADCTLPSPAPTIVSIVYARDLAKDTKRDPSQPPYASPLAKGNTSNSQEKETGNSLVALPSLVYYDEQVEEQFLAEWNSWLAPLVVLSPPIESPAPSTQEDFLSLKAQLISLVEVGFPGIFEMPVADQIISLAAKLMDNPTLQPDEILVYHKLADLRAYINFWEQTLQDEATSQAYLDELKVMRAEANKSLLDFNAVKDVAAKNSSQMTSLTQQIKEYEAEILRLQGLLTSAKQDLKATHSTATTLAQQKKNVMAEMTVLGAKVNDKKRLEPACVQQLENAKVAKHNMKKQFEFLALFKA